MEKNKIIIMSLILIILIGISNIVLAEDSNDIIEFKSSELKEILLNNGTDMNKDGNISVQEMSNVYSIYNVDKNVKDLSDLKYATNLSYLSISYEGYDISPLENCKNLITLNIYNKGDKKVKDASPLSNLTKLSTLYLSDTDVENLDFLKNLKEIKSLSITNYTSISKITNIDPVKKLTKLEKLNISDNTKEENYNITDLSPLQNITTLKEIDITNSKISDLTPLKNLINLESLYFYNNEIKSIEPLVNLTNLKRLSLNKNKIKNIEAIRKLTNLTNLELSDNQIEDFTILNEIDTDNININIRSQEYYIDLGKVNLNETIKVKLPEVIKQLQNPENYIYDSRIKEWVGSIYDELNNYSEKLEGNLTEVTINTNLVGKNKIEVYISGQYDTSEGYPDKITSIDCYITYEALVEGDKTKEIQIKDNNFKNILKQKYDIDNDGKITQYDANNIASLNLENSNIQNVEGIENFKNLKVIYASNNKIEDISPILNLEKLNKIDFSYNYITDISCVKNRKFKRITSLGIDGNYIDFSNNSKQLQIYLEELEKEIKNVGEPTYYEDGQALLCSFASSQKYGDPKNQEVEVKLDAKIKEKLISLGVDKNKDNKLTAKELTESTEGSYEGLNYIAPILKELDLSNLGLKDLSGLEYLNGIRNINLSNNNISDITPLANFMNVDTLNLSHNKITDISSLPIYTLNSTYPKKEIDLSYNQITDMSPINKWIVTHNTFYCNWRGF